LDKEKKTVRKHIDELHDFFKDKNIDERINLKEMGLEKRNIDTLKYIDAEDMTRLKKYGLDGIHIMKWPFFQPHDDTKRKLQ